MAKAVFLNTGTYDHVYPTLGLVRALVEKGEEVTYFTPEQFKPEIEYSGAAFKCNSYFTQRPSGPPFLDQPSLTDVLYSSVFYNIKARNKAMELIFSEIQGMNPDYIIYGSRAYWGQEIARKLKIPAVCLFSGMAVNKEIFYTRSQEFINRYFGGLYQPGTREIARVIAVLNQVFKKKYGIGDISEGLLIDASLNIVYTPRFMQPFADYLDETYKFVGYPLYQKKLREEFPDDIPAAPGDSAKNLVYAAATPGDKYHKRWNSKFYPLLFNALKRDERPVLVNFYSQSREYADLGVGEIPGNFKVQCPRHHGEAIARSQAVITSGSYSVVYESLLQGVPMIVIPVGDEQFLAAEQIEKLKVGIYLRPGALTEESLHEAVTAVQADSRCRENCRHYGELLRESNDDASVAEIVLNTIKTGV